MNIKASKQHWLVVSIISSVLFSVILVSSILTNKAYALSKYDCSKKTAAQCAESSPLVRDLNYLVRFLAAGVGVVVTVMIVIGGIQYITAGDNPSAVQAAKKRIFNAVFALIAFGLTFAFLEWIIPGQAF